MMSAMMPQSFARLARAAVVVLDGAADSMPIPEQATTHAPGTGPVPYDVDDDAAQELSTTVRRVHHGLIAETLFEENASEADASEAVTPQFYLSMSTSGGVGGGAGSWEQHEQSFYQEKQRKGKSCLRFVREAHVDIAEAAVALSRSVCCEDGSLGGCLTVDLDGSDAAYLRGVRYHPVNFTTPLERRKDALVLLPYREMMQEHISLSANTSGSALGATYALPTSSVEIPRNLVPQLLMHVTGDPVLRSVVMRAFYAALGDTILASDPSSPSGAGATGLSLLQFREFGKGCNSAGAAALAAKCGGPLRQPVLTAVFECAAKPFQFLPISSFCVALSLLSLSVCAAATPSSDDAASPANAKGPVGGPKKLLQTIAETLQWMCREVFTPYVAAELPVWADPDVDVYWADSNVQRTTLEYAKITRELFDIFSVSPGDEIASMLRRGSSFSHRTSTAQELPTAPSLGAGHVPTPPQNRRQSKVAPPQPRKASAAPSGMRHVVSFVDAASRKPSTVSNEQQRPTPPVESEDPLAEAPAERLRRYGFDICVSPHAPLYFVNGCDQLRILPLATLQRMVRTMNIPNVSPMDVTMAAKAASFLYRNHPFRRPLLDKGSTQGSNTSSAAAGGGKQHPNTTIGGLFGPGVNPLTRFVPSGDIFLLEREFVDVLMRLSIVAYPELAQHGAAHGVRRTARRRSASMVGPQGRRGSGASGHRRGSMGGGGALEDVETMDLPSSTLPQFQFSEFGAGPEQPRQTPQGDEGGGGVERTSNNPQTAPSLTFSDAYQRVMRTYIEGFYLSATGAGTVESGKIIVVSAEEAAQIAAQKDARATGRRASVAAVRSPTQQPGASSNTDAVNRPAPFVLAQPIVRELAITQSDSAVTYFFQSDQARENVPGWEASKHTNIVSDRGGDAVVQGHLMLDLTGFYVLVEGRVAIRAHRVLAATLSQGKKLSTAEEAANLATLAEVQIPPLTTLFSNRFIEKYLEPHRAVRCDRDGSDGLRVYPYTFVSLSLQFSNDGVHWTPVTSDHLETKWSRLERRNETAAVSDAGRLLVKQCRPTHVVPKALTEALRIVFNVYASYQEVVKEAVITTGKWSHLCACLMYVVQDATGVPPKCSTLPTPATSEDGCGKRRSSNAPTTSPWSNGAASDGDPYGGGGRTRADSPEASGGEAAAPSRRGCQQCTHCLLAQMQTFKQQHAKIALCEFSQSAQQSADEGGDKETEGLVRGVSAFSSPRHVPPPSLYAFDPQAHVPRITHQHVLEAFEKHSQTRNIHHSDAHRGGGVAPDATSYRVLSFEGMVSAIADLIINHNTTCDKQPLSMRATEQLMVPANWWMTIYGLLVLEGERRKAYNDTQVDAVDIHILPCNTHAQWAYRKLWSVNASGLSVSVDPSESAAQRSLSTLCGTFLNVARRIRSLCIFRHGACVAKVHDDPKHRAWDSGSEGHLLRNKFLTVEVFSPSHIVSIQRLVGVELPFNATIERLFKSAFLPLAADDASYAGDASYPRTARCRGDNSDSGRRPLTAHALDEPAVDRRPDTSSLVTTSARRFWILRDATTTAAVGCMSNLPGHCATLSWVPSLGSYHSPCGSLLLMEHSDVLTTESLLVFKYFLDSSAAVNPNLPYAERTLAWVRAERKLRQQLETECKLVMDPVFP